MLRHFDSFVLVKRLLFGESDLPIQKIQSGLRVWVELIHCSALSAKLLPLSIHAHDFVRNIHLERVHELEALCTLHVVLVHVEHFLHLHGNGHEVTFGLIFQSMDALFVLVT